MTEQDRETHAAIEALAHRIRVRDAAVRAGEDVDDAEPFSAEFMAALRGRGWRLTEARRIPVPKPSAPGTAAPLKPETANLLADLHADMEARAAAARAAKETAREDGAA